MRRAKQNSAADYFAVDVEGVSIRKNPAEERRNESFIQGFRRKRLHPRTLLALIRRLLRAHPFLHSL